MLELITFICLKPNKVDGSYKFVGNPQQQPSPFNNPGRVSNLCFWFDYQENAAIRTWAVADYDYDLGMFINCRQSPTEAKQGIENYRQWVAKIVRKRISPEDQVILFSEIQKRYPYDTYFKNAKDQIQSDPTLLDLWRESSEHRAKRIVKDEGLLPKDATSLAKDIKLKQMADYASQGQICLNMGSTILLTEDPNQTDRLARFHRILTGTALQIFARREYNYANI